MPVGYHHLHYRDFTSVIQRANLDWDSEVLARLEADEEALLAQARKIRSQRAALCSEILTRSYEAVRPHLRPCHQKRFDERPDSRSVELEGFGY